MDFLQNPWLYVLLVTVMPWIELRGGIPVGVALGLNPLLLLVVAVAANVAVIYPAFIFLDWFFHLMGRIPFMGRIIKKTQTKAKPYVERYGMAGLMVFVAVPLPGTGAYSGALAAHILGMKNRRAFVAIAFGVAVAGVAVLLISTVFRETLGWLLDLQIV